MSGSLVGGIALGAVGMMMMSGLMNRAGDVVAAVAPVPAAEVQFAARAVGTVAQTAVLSARPGGGESLGELLSGTAVRVGGMVRVPAGLGTRDVLWVSMADSAGPRYGFVGAENVVLSAGEVPVLQLDGADAAALLTPGMAVQHGSASDQADSATSTIAALPATGAAEPPATGTVNLPWLPPSVARWRDEFVAAGAKHHVDPELLAILALVESGGNPRVVSSAGAVGLMQIMPGTASGIAQQLGVAGHSTERLYDPAYNLDFGAFYIAQQLKSFGKSGDADWQESVELAASAYNGGPGSVQRLLNGGSLPRETQSYRRWVGGLWRERHEASPATLATWLAAGGKVLVSRAEKS
jgi:soluble lytic murein transglycosylase-like protein